MLSAVLPGAFDVPKPLPNEKDVAGFVAELAVVVAVGLASLTLEAGGVEADKEENEKAADVAGFEESFELERFNENPLLFASSPDEAPPKPVDPPKRGVVEVFVAPNPEKTDADVTAGKLPKPEKTEVVEGVAESVEFGPLLSFSELLAEKGLAVVEESPNENAFEESPAPERSDEKLGAPDGAFMVTTGDSSFFSGSLKVKEAFSLADGGWFSSCFFSTTFDGSL